LTFIGLDLSLRSTGVAGVAADGTHWTRRITPAPGLVGMPRLVDIHSQVLAIVRACGDVPLIAIEDYAIRGGENIPIVELGAVVRFALFLHQLPFVVVHPSKVKLYATGKGNADKVMVGEALRARHGVSFLRTDWPGVTAKTPRPRPDDWGEKDAHWRNDEADAFVLAHIAQQLVQPSPPGTLTDYEAQVLNAIRVDPHSVLARALQGRRAEAEP
jgi:Holliday junction resolvasome RuvABC endonuclease subunit